ncbi:MAG: TonB-dependent receptor [Chitinivibrionia bacterium]|nr:TonB-dependent receptor [Chitinivibrionia bacterium]
MKRLKLVIPILISLLAAGNASASRYSIAGTVVDGLTGARLAGAAVMIEGTALGLSSGEGGDFLFAAVDEGVYTVSASFLGYKVQKKTVVVSSDIAGMTFAMEQTILPGEKVYVTATRARERYSPAAVSNISSEELADRYTVQDIPMLLGELPSTSFYSESGNGIGYNYLTLRGFDQRRISVMINGVPQNDPEDHDVYWVDFPDLAANLQDIQLQRGAGSSFYGPPAIGGTVNLVTSVFSALPEVRIGMGYGSFDTQKYTLKLNSGLIANTYSLYGRFSRLLSDGYRNDSWVDYNSYFFGAARYTEHTTANIHVYGGPIRDHLAYYGIPKSHLNDTRRGMDSAQHALLHSGRRFFRL